MSLIKKIEVKMENWQDGVSLSFPVENARKAKISWMYYKTSDAGELLLTLKCAEFRGNGYIPNSNNSYFMKMPLDQSADVTCTYTNFYPEFDHEQQHVTPTIHSLNFECLVNGSPATGITALNPLIFEIRVYS
jgi:hypothetical protein